MATAAANRRYGSTETALPYYASAGPVLLSETPADPREKKPNDAEQKEWEALFQHNESRFQALWNWRTPYWTTWTQIARYEKPNRFYFYVTSNTNDRGLRQDFNIVDRTASICGEICASGLMTTLTDPDRLWLELGPAIPNFELDRQGKEYYEDLTERLNYIYDHSNFYEAQAQGYDDLTFFGNAVAIDYEDVDTILNVFTPCAGEYMVGVNFENSAEVLDREFRQTVSQTVEMFGPENLPGDVLQMWRQKGGALEYENVIGHSIEPNFPIMGPAGQDDFGVVPGGYTWRETYWLRGKKTQKPLLRNGFHDQPHAVMRWATQGNEAYGRGPGEMALGDTIQLQLETRQKAESIEKVNRPPMGADVSLQNLNASTNPGKITYMNTAAGGEKKFWSLYEIRPDIPAITADIKVIQDRIGRTFYNDVFQMLMTLRYQMQLKADMTTVEINRLEQEVLTRMGPMIYRVYQAQRQRVKRHIGIMQRRGLMPRKPPSLQRVPTKIDFVSLLTEAKRKVKTEGIARSMQFGGSLSGAWPEMKYAYDAVEGARLFNDGVGGPAKLIRTDDEIQQLIQREKQQQQMAAALQQTLPGAKSAEALSKTSLAPGSALSALVNPAGGMQG